MFLRKEVFGLLHAEETSLSQDRAETGKQCVTLSFLLLVFFSLSVSLSVSLFFFSGLVASCASRVAAGDLASLQAEGW